MPSHCREHLPGEHHGRRDPPAPQLLNQGTSYSYVGNADFHRCFCDLLDSAQTEIIDYVIPETRPDEHDKFILGAYGAAGRRGIAMRTLIAPEHLHLVQSTWDPEFNMRDFLQKFPHIKLVKKVNGPFTVVDRQRVLLNLPDPYDAAEYTTSVVVVDEKLAESLIGTFDRIWADAQGEQETLLTRVGEPGKLEPRQLRSREAEPAPH